MGILNRSVKVKIKKEVCDEILAQSDLSKKDLGLFISDVLQQQHDLDKSVKRFLSKKYDIDPIADLLAKSKKKTITFNEIRKSLNLSKRKFYPRLKLIQKTIRPQWEWQIKRGKFVRT